ncbi:MAG: SUMF1/EgtB/PvdO family nonheme iron enzyme [Treponemataceae bacterium]|nr:SUMF1/EgtB/PvdO family nonheme iron enzyme [Treponemataceae bacterium]
MKSLSRFITFLFVLAIGTFASITAQTSGTAVSQSSTSINDGFIFVEGGSFTMGNNSGNTNEKPAHKVTVNSFYICDHEVTEAEYEAVMWMNPSDYVGDDYPVDSVKWFDALEYCNRLSRNQGLTPCYQNNHGVFTCDWNANGYRLPTEAEWEYAARGGAKSKGYTYSGSKNISIVAWYGDNSGYESHEVKTKKPNELGIYDMNGNVLEWCWDWYGSFGSAAETNPKGKTTSHDKVIRGGSYYDIPSDSTVSARYYADPSGGNPNLGFRVVRNADSIASGKNTTSSTAQTTTKTKGMVLVKGGSFAMGSNTDEYNEQRIHDITVSSFYMCDHEVTQAEFASVIGTFPSRFEGDNKPVEQVSWFDALEYCNMLSIKEGLTPCYSYDGTVKCDWNANGYRLPTEAEWEYAARGGSKNRGYTYSGSNRPETVAWYNENSNEETHDVKTKQPNALGIYDLSGNVGEWCWDWYDYYYPQYYEGAKSTNPHGPDSASSHNKSRIYRGAFWCGDANYCRVSARLFHAPDYVDASIGFRVVRNAE